MRAQAALRTPLAAAQPAEVILRAFDLAPVRQVRVFVTGGPGGDAVTARLGSGDGRVLVGPGETREIVLPAGRGFRYYDTYLYVLHFRSERGGPGASGEAQGPFLSLELVLGPVAGR